MIEYRYLRAFFLTCRHKSFSQAAKEMRVAQSAISRQVKLLEESVGQDLIIRSSKRVLLTPKGQELFRSVEHFQENIDTVLGKETQRPLRIGVLHGLLEAWFSPLAARFHKKWPHGLNIRVDQQEGLVRSMEEGVFDAIFTTHNVQSELLSSLRLFDEKTVLISKGPVDLKKLHSFSWVVYGADDPLYLLSKQVSSKILMVNSMTSVVDMVKNGAGIAVVPDHMLKPKGALVITPLDGPKTSIYLTTLNFRTLPAGPKEFVDFVKDHGVP